MYRLLLRREVGRRGILPQARRRDRAARRVRAGGIRGGPRAGEFEVAVEVGRGRTRTRTRTRTCTRTRGGVERRLGLGRVLLLLRERRVRRGRPAGIAISVHDRGDAVVFGVRQALLPFPLLSLDLLQPLPLPLTLCARRRLQRLRTPTREVRVSPTTA